MPQNTLDPRPRNGVLSADPARGPPRPTGRGSTGHKFTLARTEALSGSGWRARPVGVSHLGMGLFGVKTQDTTPTVARPCPLIVAVHASRSSAFNAPPLDSPSRFWEGVHLLMCERWAEVVPMLRTRSRYSARHAPASARPPLAPASQPTMRRRATPPLRRGGRWAATRPRRTTAATRPPAAPGRSRPRTGEQPRRSPHPPNSRTRLKWACPHCWRSRAADRSWEVRRDGLRSRSSSHARHTRPVRRRGLQTAGR